MPSMEHEGIVELFRRDPALAADLLRLRGIDVPAYDDVQVAAPDVGVTVSSHRADVLLLFKRGAHVVLVIVVEIQRQPDPAKAFVWPFYWAAAALESRCPAMVLVYATTPETVRWAREELVVGSLSGGPCHRENRPIVLGSADIPPLTRDEAFERPYLAAFSAMAHANEEGGLHVVRIALDAAERLPPDFSVILRDTLFAALNDALRRVLMKEPDMQGYVLKSDIMRKWHAEATAEGEANALRRTLVQTLRARGLVIDEATAQRVAESSDRALLERWFSRALTAATVEEVFAD